MPERKERRNTNLLICMKKMTIKKTKKSVKLHQIYDHPKLLTVMEFVLILRQRALC